MHEQLGERETHVLRHAVSLIVELGKRPFANRHHIGAPRKARLGDGSECERPTPFRRDSLEQRCIERRQRGRPEDLVPVERALDQATHALDLLDGRSRKQFEAN